MLIVDVVLTQYEKTTSLKWKEHRNTHLFQDVDIVDIVHRLPHEKPAEDLLISVSVVALFQMVEQVLLLLEDVEGTVRELRFHIGDAEVVEQIELFGDIVVHECT